MIRLIKKGTYRLIETKEDTKILTLDNKKSYAWVKVQDIGEILITTKKEHKQDALLSVGNYRLYKVKDEPEISDHLHLELSVGKDEWQGYLLLTGLPTELKKRNRIIPTKELITTKFKK